jgi:hypothetical protein
MFSIRRHDQQAGRVEGCSYEQPLALGKSGSCTDTYQFNRPCHSSSQTFSSRSSPSHRQLLGRLVTIPLHPPHHGRHSVDRRSSAMQPMSPHHPLGHIAHTLRTAHAPHILWTTYHGLLPPGTWQLRLAAQRYVHSPLLVPPLSFH